MGVQEDIRKLEDEIKNTQYNKATQKHIGKLKSKLAKLREESQNPSGSGGSAGPSYAIRKTGDATVAFVGFPSVGKSTLLNKLTNANSEVGAYAFTTLTIIPGLMEHKGAKIQVLDAPGIISGASFGRGRGSEVLAAVRNVDLIMVIVDVFSPEHIPVIERELSNVGIRLDQIPPEVKIAKRDRGGVAVNTTLPLSKIDEDTVVAILGEYKIHNADIVIRDDVDADQLIDSVMGNRSYIPTLVIINKIDLADQESLDIMESEVHERPHVFVSGHKEINLEELKDKIFDTLGFIKLYLKPQGKKADMTDPLIILKNSKVKDVCNKLHRDFVKNFRYAQVWGPSAKHPGQRVGLDHVLGDGDILSIVVKKSGQ
ncbi:OBG GTPase family GTP-binding protein [Methanococcus voltae]|uniref:Small GTP-binding protein n=1 Tax=Methanococcus voltae (strain ATCC BAA-1334 / A3) TaxID=456320 RepID=D7DQK7_METV3|nr:GTP-binding protein [Methanococcus voltae]MCS3901630.1 small GTP-binding protein [Methanococcus voltae]